MKKIFAILFVALMFVVATNEANAQRGRVKTLTVDTLQGNENVTFDAIALTGSYSSVIISAKVERISTAAGGTLTLKSGIDSGSALTINQSTNTNLNAAPNDTLATSDVATQYVNWELVNPAAKNYYVFGDGDADDTVKVTISYMYK